MKKLTNGNGIVGGPHFAITHYNAGAHPTYPGECYVGTQENGETEAVYPYTVVGASTVADAGANDFALPLADQKAAKKTAVTELYRQKSEIPVNVGGVLISAFDGPLMELIGAKVGSKAQRKFVTALGQKVSVTQAELNALFSAVDDHKQLLRDREYDLYDAIDAAADIAALNAIDITVGWPA